MSLPGEADIAGQTVETCFNDDFSFASVDYIDIRRIIAALHLNKDDVVYEIGAGLGRVCCVFARRKVSRVIAVELNPILAGRLRKNASGLRGRKCPIDITLADAAMCNLDHGTVYFFFNPFGSDTLRAVLANIEHSLQRFPRKIQIIYMNPQLEHRTLLDTLEWIKLTGQIKTIRRLDVLIMAAGT